MTNGNEKGCRIVVLSENTAGGQGILAEHGLSFWIEYGERHILFDTGQGMVLLHNARRLHVPLDSVDAVVLSHGHFDHTGGLGDVLNMATAPEVYAHPAVFTHRYACSDSGWAREIGIPDLDETSVRAKASLVLTLEPAEVAPGVHATGPIPRTTDYEDTGNRFFTDAACSKPDAFPDDQALYLDTARGLVVVLGCAHAGVINTLNYIHDLTGGKRIHTLMGGMHLVSAGEGRLDRTVEYLRGFGIERLMPAHCTGFTATARLAREFPAHFVSCRAGAVIEIECAPD